MADPHVESQAPAPLGREAILAQLDAEPEVETAPPAEAVVADESDEEVESVEAAAEDDETEVEASDEDDDEAPAEDPKTQKGLDAVRRAEKRHREQMDRDRAEFAAEKAKHAEKIARLDDYDAAAKRVAYDPVSLLKSMKVPPEAYGAIAHAIFAESPEGAKDPARVAAAQQRLRDREKDDDLTATKKEIAAINARIEADKQERAQAAETERYIGAVNAAGKADPLVAHMMAHSPDDVGDGLGAAFDRLKAKTGKDPKPGAVVAEYARKERGRLLSIGVDPEAVIKAKPIANGTKVAKPGAKAAPVAANANKTLTREEILASIPD